MKKSYNHGKDKLRTSGETRTKFKYFDKMDAILGTNPVHSCVSVNVGIEELDCNVQYLLSESADINHETFGDFDDNDQEMEEAGPSVTTPRDYDDNDQGTEEIGLSVTTPRDQPSLNLRGGTYIRRRKRAQNNMQLYLDFKEKELREKREFREKKIQLLERHHAEREEAKLKRHKEKIQLKEWELGMGLNSV